MMISINICQVSFFYQYFFRISNYPQKFFRGLTQWAFVTLGSTVFYTTEEILPTLTTKPWWISLTNYQLQTKTMTNYFEMNCPQWCLIDQYMSSLLLLPILLQYIKLPTKLLQGINPMCLCFTCSDSYLHKQRYSYNLDHLSSWFFSCQ